MCVFLFFFVKQKSAYEMRISDGSSDVCSSDLLLVDKAANDTAAGFLKRKIREIVKDPETARLLSDIDHPFATKRPPIDSDYFDAFNRPNVSLADANGRASCRERVCQYVKISVVAA